MMKNLANRPHVYKKDERLAFRNLQIREEFKMLKQRGVKNKDAFSLLADKYFLSEFSINSIIYLKKDY